MLLSDLIKQCSHRKRGDGVSQHFDILVNHYLLPQSKRQFEKMERDWDPNRSDEEYVQEQNYILGACLRLERSQTGKNLRREAGLKELADNIEILEP